MDKKNIAEPLAPEARRLVDLFKAATDQPRDDDGRFASSGSSPEEHEKHLKDALRQRMKDVSAAEQAQYRNTPGTPESHEARARVADARAAKADAARELAEHQGDHNAAAAFGREAEKERGNAVKFRARIATA